MKEVVFLAKESEKVIVTIIDELKKAIEKADVETMVSISLDMDEREVPDNAKGGKVRA